MRFITEQQQQEILILIFIMWYAFLSCYISFSKSLVVGFGGGFYCRILWIALPVDIRSFYLDFQIDFFAFEHGIPSQWLFQISNRQFSSQKSFQLGSFMYFYGIRYGLKLLHFKSHIRIVIFQQFTLFCG